MTKKNTNALILFYICLFIILIFFGISIYSNQINISLTQSTTATLEEISSQKQFLFDTTFENEIAHLNTVSRSLTMSGLDDDEISQYLEEIAIANDYSHLSLAKRNNVVITNSGRILHVQLTDIFPYFQRVLEGETIVEAFDDEDTGNRILSISVPSYDNGSITGAVTAQFYSTNLDELMASSFGGNAYIFIVDEQGDIITDTSNEFTLATNNIFDSLEQATFEDLMSVDKLIEEMNNKKDGILYYELEGNSRIAEYKPLQVNDWYLFVAIPREVVTQSSGVIIQQVAIFNIGIGAAMALLILFIMFFHKNSVKELEQALYYDELTHIPNRVKFKIEVKRILEENPKNRFIIVKLDIADFKAINELFTFEMGNSTLTAIADVGKTVEGHNFVQARVGTDEFLLFADYDFFENLDEMRHFYEALFASIAPVAQFHNIRFRYGRYIIPLGCVDVEDIVHKVILTHSFAKTRNIDEVCDYDEELRSNMVKTSEITNKMKPALANNEFLVYLQPKYKLKDNQIGGAEALVRWREPDGTFVYPNEFIPIFENNGFIVELDRYMLKKVCEIIKDWLEKGYDCFPISVNFSRLHMVNPHFTRDIEEIVESYNIPTRLIEVELTENIFIDNSGIFEKLINELHDMGFTLSVDDFGSGYSSLGLLQNVNADVIKLDKSFFDEINEDGKNEIVVESIISMLNKLNMKTVAEGVETKEQVDFLRKVQCDMVQGYYFAKPMPLDEFEKKYEISI